MLRLVGLCGVDNNTNMADIVKLNKKYPFIEWGILFHSHKINQPRYPGWPWINNLLNYDIRLAAHFCGNYVNDLLCGETTFLRKIINLGFKRIQINATRANDVELSIFPNKKYYLGKIFKTFSDIEFILQRNQETEDLCIDIEKAVLPNVSFLYDASCGQGIYDPEFLDKIKLTSLTRNIGFAGGFSPTNISQVLNELSFKKFPGRLPWIDMESHLRLNDCFSIEIAEEICQKIKH